mgnify:CR=1 FL=1
MTITKEDIIEYLNTSDVGIIQQDIDLESIRVVDIKENYVLIKYYTKDLQHTKNASIPLHLFKDLIRDKKINEILS